MLVGTTAAGGAVVGGLVFQQRLPYQLRHQVASHRFVILAAELLARREVTVHPAGRTVLVEQVGSLPEAVPINGGADDVLRVVQMLHDRVQTFVRTLLVARCGAGEVLHQLQLYSRISFRLFRAIEAVKLAGEKDGTSARHIGG